MRLSNDHEVEIDCNVLYHIDVKNTNQQNNTAILNLILTLYFLGHMFQFSLCS